MLLSGLDSMDAVDTKSALAQSINSNAFVESKTQDNNAREALLRRIQSAYEATALEDLAKEGDSTEQDNVSTEPPTTNIKLQKFHIGSSDLDGDSSPETPQPPDTPLISEVPQPTGSPETCGYSDIPGTSETTGLSETFLVIDKGKMLEADLTHETASSNCENSASNVSDADGEKRKKDAKILQRRATFPYFSFMSDEPIEGSPDPIPSPEPKILTKKVPLSSRKSNPEPKQKPRSKSFRRPRLSSLSNYAARSKSIVDYTAGLLRGKEDEQKKGNQFLKPSKADIVKDMEKTLLYSEDARRAYRERGKRGSIGMKCVLTREDRPDLFASIDGRCHFQCILCET